MCPVCILYMSCLGPVRVLHVCCTCPACVVYLSCTCLVHVLYVLCTCLTCVLSALGLHMSCMFPPRALVSYMCPASAELTGPYLLSPRGPNNTVHVPRFVPLCCCPDLEECSPSCLICVLSSSLVSVLRPLCTWPPTSASSPTSISTYVAAAILALRRRDQVLHQKTNRKS